MTQPEFFGARLRRKALLTGLLTGVLNSAVLVSWLWMANHMPRLETYAAIRNWVCGAMTVAIMAIPVLRFLRQPITLFISGVTGWTLLTITYMILETRYSLLESRMGALQVFIMGSLCYSLVAAFQWVFRLCAEVRHRHLERSTVPTPTRRLP